MDLQRLFSYSNAEIKPFIDTLRIDLDTRNFGLAHQFTSELCADEDVLDHLQELHALLAKDTLPDDHLGLFRKEGIDLLNFRTGEVYDSIEILDFDVQIEKLKNQKKHFQGLDVLAFEHIALLKIHPFYDGNGRLARFILCRRLEAMGGKYFYRYLETRNQDYKRVMNQIFYEKKPIKYLSSFLRRITVF